MYSQINWPNNNDELNIVNPDHAYWFGYRYKADPIKAIACILPRRCYFKTVDDISNQTMHSFTGNK